MVSKEQRMDECLMKNVICLTPTVLYSLYTQHDEEKISIFIIKFYIQIL